MEDEGADIEQNRAEGEMVLFVVGIVEHLIHQVLHAGGEKEELEDAEHSYSSDVAGGVGSLKSNAFPMRSVPEAPFLIS